MLTQALLCEVEQQCVARNYEVALFLVDRLCNHQKFKLKLRAFITSYGDPDWIDDEIEWRHKRRLQRKVGFSDPCYRCPACRKDPIVLARLSGFKKENEGPSPFSLTSF